MAIPSPKDTQRGASIIEFALLICLVALVGFAGVRGLGKKVEDVFDKTRDGMNATGSIPCGPSNPAFPDC
jgi:Flp pilus assembly pilin Flp